MKVEKNTNRSKKMSIACPARGIFTKFSEDESTYKNNIFKHINAFYNINFGL